MKTSELHTLRSILTEGIKIDGHNDPVEISCIYVPKIQRAYAQGRNKESDVRKDFLDALFAVLTSPEEQSIELGFLFGSKQIIAKKSAEGFELLDGQQRVTTLFLLYWYVSMKEKKCVPEFLLKFTYETRDTSTQFLSNITAQYSKIDIQKTSPSVAIKHNKWFTDEYYCDPTVCAMLTMLDSIDELYAKYHCNDIFDNLEKLKFYVLMLEKFDMNDELYIKMNSRGLSLTPFENFKAAIVQFMKSNEKCLYGSDKVENNRAPFWFDFISDTDAKWIDIFWKLNISEEEKDKECNEIIEIDDHLIGTRYFGFINRYLFTKASLTDSLSNSKINSLTSFFYKDAESEKMKSRLFGLENYEKIFLQYEESAQLEDTIFYQMQKVLDTFHAHKDDIEKSIQGDPYGRTVGFKIDADKFNNFHERVAFAAVTEFIENIPEDFSFDNEIVQTNFKRMLRVAFNIIENTLIESPEAAVRVIKILHIMNSAHGAISDNFYRSLATTAFESDNRQLQEEILKAKEMFSENECINYIPEWEEAFMLAEHHPFFKGSIRFFFTEKAGDSENFIARYYVMKDLFDKDGITEEYRTNNHILLRAIFSRLNTWRTLGNRYFTEQAEREKYLKNMIIGNEAVRKLFCNYFDLNIAKPIAEYLADEISNASPQENESHGFKMLFNRLVKDTRSVPLLDWVHEREINKGKKFYIQENRSSLVINIPGKWYDRMLLDTERDKIIPVLVEKYDMEYDDANQKKMMESPIGDSFGWSVSIKKRIECRSQSFDIKMTFNEWKWVDFYIYGQNVGQLVSRFNVPVEKIHKDYIQLRSVQYCMLKDMQNIDKEISHIIKVVQE